MRKYEQIIAALEIAVKSGGAGQALPSVRQLAAAFGCSKATVVQAYQQMVRQHRVYAVPQSGYYPVKAPPELRVSEDTLIHFTSAAPDGALLPFADFQHCLAQAIDVYEQRLFAYNDPQGLPELRKVLAAHLADYQVFAKPEQIVVTSGAQQALSLLASLPFPNGRAVVALEQPVYAGMVAALNDLGIPAVGVRRTSHGFDLAEVERLFAGGDIKCFYTNPRLQNPAGDSLARQQRQALVKLAAQHDVYVLEDDCFADLAAGTESLPLFYEDSAARVIYIKSFSKTLLPGLRLAAVVVPPLLVPAMVRRKKWLDLGTALLSQGALALYLQAGMLRAHRRRLQAIYAEKLQVVREMTAAAFLPDIVWQVPANGFFVSAALPQRIDQEYVRAVCWRHGVELPALQQYYLTADVDNSIFLSISQTPLSSLRQGIRQIIEALTRYERQG